MKTSNLKFSLIAVLAVILSAGMANAQPSGGGERDGASERQREGGEKRERGNRGDRQMKALFQDIELSEEQTASVKEVMEGFKEQRTEIREKMRELRGSDDKEAMQALAAEMRELSEEINTAVREVLTEDQQAQFDENIETLKEKMEERRAKRESGEKGERGEKRERGEKKDRGGDDTEI